MRKIENKFAKLSETESVTYGELIMTCVKNQPNGFDYETLKKVQRVDDVIGKDKLSESFEFEDSDYDFIKQKVKDMKWGIFSVELINFVKYIIE